MYEILYLSFSCIFKRIGVESLSLYAKYMNATLQARDSNSSKLARLTEDRV